MRKAPVLAALAIVATSAAVRAEELPPDGHKLSPSVNLLIPRDTDGGGKKTCIPAGTTLMVVGRSEDGKGIQVTPSIDEERKACTDPKGDGVATIVPNVTYVLSKDVYDRTAFAHRGATYGALVIPFKYQLKGEKQFTGGASLGGYAGYRFERLSNLGITATPILFMGASSIAVKGDTADSQKNLMGFTYGLGLVGTFNKQFQSGVVLGWDRVGKNDGYAYNGKPWLAVQIGYAFLQ